MRVAVIGATGNVGTEVLAALARRPEVTSVLGIARRLPVRTEEPYASAEWAAIDIGGATPAQEAIAELTEALRGADAVIHLAWLIQPNSHRDLLRRVNVEGTAHVGRAAAEAGVGTLVVASSVGAYSPSPGREVRDESWPTGGVRTSHYSVDKVAQEQVLDEIERMHPAMTLTRLRPALIFQGDAGSEIQRYFLGRWMPVQLLRAGRPPLLPLPRGLRIQAVHARDVAEAYAAAAVAEVPGAFNICADDVLDVRDLAHLVGTGRAIELPVPAVRAALATAHRAGLVAADPGWLDMGMNVPVMDNARADRELGWRPRYSAADALSELLEGMADGRGTGSVPMRARDSRRARLAVDGTSAGEGAGRDAGASPRIDTGLLGLYLSDHLTGAAAGAARIDRMAADFVDTPVHPVLSSIAEQIRAERRFLHQLIDDLGLRRRRYRQAAAWLGEHAGRLKSNGRLVARSPMTMVLEAELMRSAVIGKRGSWLTLADNAQELGLDEDRFRELAEQALHQFEQLEAVHAYARRRAFRTDRGTFDPPE
ncbi:NAD-dependent epimerase/dehydratase family protein [Brachybacterium paraconglomeratum]